MARKLTTKQKVTLRAKLDRFSQSQALFGLSIGAAAPMTKPETEEWHEAKRDLLAYIGLALEPDADERQKSASSNNLHKLTQAFDEGCS